MKLLLSLFIVIACSCSVNAQSFFKPLPKPAGFSAGKFSLASDSVQNSFRPVASVTASTSAGVSLAGGFGISFQHNKWSVESQAWITQYAVSALGFITTNGVGVGGVGGLVVGIPGTNGLINVGPGYDFTNKQLVFLSGVIFKFN